MAIQLISDRVRRQTLTAWCSNPVTVQSLWNCLFTSNCVTSALKSLQWHLMPKVISTTYWLSNKDSPATFLSSSVPHENPSSVLSCSSWIGPVTLPWMDPMHSCLSALPLTIFWSGIHLGSLTPLHLLHLIFPSRSFYHALHTFSPAPLNSSWLWFPTEFYPSLFSASISFWLLS